MFLFVTFNTLRFPTLGSVCELLRHVFSCMRKCPGRELKPVFGGDFPTIARSVLRKRTKQPPSGMELDPFHNPGSRLERLKFLHLIPTEQVVLLYLLGNMLIALKSLKIWR